MLQANNQNDPKGEAIDSGNTEDTPPKEETTTDENKIIKETKITVKNKQKTVKIEAQINKESSQKNQKEQK